MRLPNLIATKWGRLTAFFFLYMTEGIPLGFVAIAIAAELRRQGVGPAEIGAFVGMFYVPWAFKWSFGPFVDVFSSEKLGRRRMWIVLAQFMMVFTLLLTIGIELPKGLWLFTIILFIHNLWAATQDVAIDALAVNVLSKNERGLANGIMFAGASIGQVVGGSGVLYLKEWGLSFQGTFFFVAACLLSVTIFIALPLREPRGDPKPPVQGSRLAAAGREVREFAAESMLSFLQTRSAFTGFFFALLPAGALSLGLALQSNLAVELGFSDGDIADLNTWSAVLFSAFCVLGGFLSDRFGRRRVLAVSVVLASLPTWYMASALWKFGWIMPQELDDPNRPVVAAGLVTALWIATLTFNVFNGVMYGTRSALFMDVTNPAVAATQFTAYMALLNLVISYSATWQGIAIEQWGYPRTMMIDGAFGLACLALLPLMKKMDVTAHEAHVLAGRRARAFAAMLAVVILTYVPYRAFEAELVTISPIVNTFFTLAFTASGVYLITGWALVRRVSPGVAKAGLVLSPFLMAMHARYYVDTIAGWLGMTDGDAASPGFAAPANAYLYGVPVIGALFLLWLASGRTLPAAMIEAENEREATAAAPAAS